MKIRIYRYGNYINSVTNDEQLHKWIMDNVYYPVDGAIPAGTDYGYCRSIAEARGYEFREDGEIGAARELCRHARIEEIVCDTLPAEFRGENYICDCPFCGKKNVAYTSPKYQIFGCFRCGARENAVSFVMRTRQLDFPMAKRWIEKRYVKQ
mgnify:FL=1